MKRHIYTTADGLHMHCVRTRAGYLTNIFLHLCISEPVPYSGTWHMFCMKCIQQSRRQDRGTNNAN